MTVIEREQLAIKDGHEIRKRTRTEYAAWCAFCKAYVPDTADFMQWTSDGWKDGQAPYALALGRLARHLELAHKVEYDTGL